MLARLQQSPWSLLSLRPVRSTPISFHQNVGVYHETLLQKASVRFTRPTISYDQPRQVCKPCSFLDLSSAMMAMRTHRGHCSAPQWGWPRVSACTTLKPYRVCPLQTDECGLSCGRPCPPDSIACNARIRLSFVNSGRSNGLPTSNVGNHSTMCR